MFYAYNSLTVPTITKPKSQPNSPKSKRRQPGVTPIPSPIPQRRLVEMGGEAREEPLQGDNNIIRQQKVNNVNHSYLQCQTKYTVNFPHIPLFQNVFIWYFYRFR